MTYQCQCDTPRCSVHAGGQCEAEAEVTIAAGAGHKASDRQYFCAECCVDYLMDSYDAKRQAAIDHETARLRNWNTWVSQRRVEVAC